ncbi:hypothetical protein Pelo_4018 [Pelomyxa schiedti]|nr:hypothetical protein Pelo_4018 [Pelomyxa schiedti]
MATTTPKLREACRPVLASSFRSLERDDVVWAFRAASALFPLVALVCRGVAAAPAVLKRPGDEYPEPHSRHWDLRCAALAGSTTCIAWMLRHKPTTNNAKDCLGVLWGLCGGGHLALAKQLVDGDDADAGTDKRGAGGLGCDYGRRANARWVRESGLEWPVCANGLRDEVREVVVTRGGDDTLMSVVCAGGHIDTAKWVVERFGLKESWELAAPFMAAVRAGKLEVAKWLCSSFGVVWAVNMLGLNYPADLSVGGDLEMIKWLVEVFPDSWKWEKDAKTCTPLVLCDVMNNRDITLKERIEAFQWIKSYFSFDQEAIQNASLQRITNVESLKWLVETHGVVLSDALLSVLWWKSVEGVESVEWLVKHHRMSLTVATFVGACRNIKDDLHCVKVLSQVVDLPPTSPDEALVVALATGNMKIANWLESSFHVLEKNIKSSPERVNSTLGELCTRSGNHCDTRAIKWFFQQVPAPVIQEDTVTGLIFKRRVRFSILEFLLGFFHLPAISSLWAEVRWSKFACHTGGLPVEEVARAIMMAGSHYYSGSVIKRLIQEVVHLQLSRVFGRAGCHVSLAMWKMLLRVFPEITADFACQRMAGSTLSSPIHIEYVRRNLGLTHDHIMHLVQAKPGLLFPASKETELWLHKSMSSDGGGGEASRGPCPKRPRVVASASGSGSGSGGECADDVVAVKLRRGHNAEGVRSTISDAVAYLDVLSFSAEQDVTADIDARLDDLRAFLESKVESKRVELKKQASEYLKMSLDKLRVLNTTAFDGKQRLFYPKERMLNMLGKSINGISVVYGTRITDLPMPVLVHIIKYLPPYSIVALRAVGLQFWDAVREATSTRCILSTNVVRTADGWKLSGGKTIETPTGDFKFKVRFTPGMRVDIILTKKKLYAQGKVFTIKTTGTNKVHCRLSRSEVAEMSKGMYWTTTLQQFTKPPDRFPLTIKVLQNDSADDETSRLDH